MSKSISPKKLNLFFPEWQGYGEHNSVMEGATIIRNHLSDRFSFKDVPVLAEEHLEVAHNVLGYEAAINMLQAARELLIAEQPGQLFMIGGTCASELAPVSYLNHLHESKIAVLWFDAHGDLNSPASSTSKHFHGMPLRCLLGEGPEEVSQLLFSQLSPEQIFLVGTRDLDGPEQEFINQQQIDVFSPEQLETPELLIQKIKDKGFESIYLHLDLDILEPTDFPHLLIQVPDGVRYSQVLELIKSLTSSFHLAGSSIVEYVPEKAGDLQKIDELVTALHS